MAAQTTHLVSQTQSCECGAFLRERGWEITRIPGRDRAPALTAAIRCSVDFPSPVVRAVLYARSGGDVDVDKKGMASTLTAPYLGARPPPVSSPAPVRAGRYELGEALGAGAMGVVYRARDPELHRVVAIKLVRTGGTPRTSEAGLLREAQAMARLRHPNVVPIFDVGLADGAVFVAMPLLEGGTLRQWLRDGPRSLAAILDRFVAAGNGLVAAHAAGLVHRDFKPDNVLLSEDGEVLVADFGLARLADPGRAAGANAVAPGSEALSQAGDVIGTPAYMPPEQLCGRPIDARADQFSFCVALWEGLYGARPFAAPRPGNADPMQARLDAIAAGPALPPRGDRPAWIAQLLVRGLAADPDRRWPSMQHLVAAIAGHRARRRGPWRVAGALVAVAMALAIVAQARPTPPPLLRVVQVTHRGDIEQAAISPDGGTLALIVGDALMVRGIQADAEDRVVVAHGISGAQQLVWSPDSKYLLVGAVPEIVTRIEGELVDVERGVMFKLPQAGMSAFLSSTELAVTSFRQRTVAVFPVAAHATAITTCDVPGDYAVIWSLIGLPDGTMIVETARGPDHALVILRRNCEVQATFSAEPFSSVATSDDRTIVALAAGEGFGEILEISLDGVVLSRRRVSADLENVLGRRHGADYVSTRTLKTHLDRVHGHAPPLRQLSISRTASFSLAPDGETLAWIERGDRQAPGLLRLSSLQDLQRRGRPLLDNAFTAAWSPDGSALAVLVRDGRDVAVVVVNRAGEVSQRLPLHHLERAAYPVWLDDHRIAAQTDDRLTYRWFDLNTSAQGDVVDRAHGSTYWLARSPRDGELAMWRNGTPGTIDAHTEHVWLQAVGHEARPLAIEDAARHHLVPSWSPSGELFVRAIESGVVSRVALDTGALTPIAQRPETPLDSELFNHLMVLPDGDVLAVETELNINLFEVRTDAETPAGVQLASGRDPL
jgi:tRNA A-37 threonylcarbamoyl transferase component Bud32